MNHLIGGIISGIQRRNVMKKLWVVLGVTLLAALTAAMGGGLFAQATTKYLSVSPASFRPINWDQMAVLMWVGTDDEFNFDTTAFGVFEAVAPVVFPHGAVIKKLTVYYTVNGVHTNDYFVGALTRRKLATGGNGVLASMTTQGVTPSTVRKTVEVPIAKNNKVDNLKYTYSLRLFYHSGDVNVKFNGAVIEYE
jgi:hypothetical protein